MTLSIIEALDDPALFANHFRGDTWRPWRTVLKALFALPMGDAETALYRAHTGRTEAPAAPFKEAAFIVGRRGGKSRLLALIAVYLACFRDYAPYLAPGEVATIAVIAADQIRALQCRATETETAAVHLLACGERSSQERGNCRHGWTFVVSGKPFM
jgi:hypothetical protein